MCLLGQHSLTIFSSSCLFFQPNEAGFVLLGDLTLDSSTDPDDGYQMVRCSRRIRRLGTPNRFFSCFPGSAIALRRRVRERLHRARREVQHSNAAKGSEGEFFVYTTCGKTHSFSTCPSEIISTNAEFSFFCCRIFFCARFDY